jgi:hypothetical protein
MSVPGQILRWRDPVKATLARCNYKDLREDLILAMIWTESSGHAWAWNPEPRYRWLWNVKLDAPFRKMSVEEIAAKDPPEDFPCFAGDPDQEWWGQQASWGLMQIMGAAAREQGFRGAYLTELAEPYCNIEFGLKHLWFYAFQHGNRTTNQAMLRWNGGGDAEYPDKVMKKLHAIEAAQLEARV